MAWYTYMRFSFCLLCLSMVLHYVQGAQCQNKSDDSGLPTVTVCFSEYHRPQLCEIKKRRVVIEDVGYEENFHGWADVQGQGAANDYCRFVGYPHEKYFSCALAGDFDKFEDRNYNSAANIPVGIDNTWYMKDEDGDGRDDYCRCIDYQGRYVVMCTKAGPLGFYGSSKQGGESLTFAVDDSNTCNSRPVRKEFGRATVINKNPS